MRGGKSAARLSQRAAIGGTLAALATGAILTGKPQDASADVCDALSLPYVNVGVVQHPVHFDYTRTLAQLSSIENDTLFSLQDAQVGGLSAGGIDASAGVQFETDRSFFTGATCISIASIDVQLHVRPLIYIARELQPGTCERRALQAHEMEHVAVDRQIAEEFVPRIWAALTETSGGLQEIGRVPREFVPAVQTDMRNAIGTRLDREIGAMQVVRDRRQQAVDSPENYRKLAEACP